MSNYLVVSNRKIQNAEYFKNPEELEVYLRLHNEIDTLIFPFWSWKVPTWMLNTYKCYGLHTGFLLDGKGKGGSPIDNLKRLGVKMAALNVFEMTDIIDDGRVRLGIPLRMDLPKDVIIGYIDAYLPRITEFLKQDISNVPERFERLKDAK